MHHDSYNSSRHEWDRRLRVMADRSRASRHEAFNAPLALLTLTHLKRRDKLSTAYFGEDPLERALALSAIIEPDDASKGLQLGQSLLAGLRDVDSATLSEWLKIASEDAPVYGFNEWFTDRLDELDFTRQHDTPSSVSRLIATLLSDCSPHTILDPACGTGGLIASVARVFGEAALFGQEMSAEALAWAKLRFLVLGINHVELATGSALTRPAFDLPATTQGFDLVVVNPPFGIPSEAQPIPLTSHHSPHHGLLLSGRIASETAYVQRVVESLSRSGAGAVIVPKGFLSRGGTDQKLRESLVRDDTVHAIVGLPPRLFAPGTMIETAIIFLRRRKREDQKGRVLLIDARNLGRREGVKVVLDDEAIGRIKSRFTTWQDEVGVSRVMSLNDFGYSDVSFLPSRYIASADELLTMDADTRRSYIEDLDAQYTELRQEYEVIRSRLEISQ